MIEITNLSQLDFEKKYSYADYLTWKIEETVELIKGKIFKMSPAPNMKHQRISRNITIALGLHFKGKPCELFAAPFDVRLFDKKKSDVSNKEIFTVVQPDLCVICDSEKLDEHGCLGTPDLVIEILSQGNSKKEMRFKYELYEEAGVREYWIIHPENCYLQQFVLNEKNVFYLQKTYIDEDVVDSAIFPDLTLDLRELF